MRPIKFRFYRTKKNEMVYGFDGCSLTYVLDIWENEKHVSDPMQYTALKDIKGNSLYEKDLLKDDENFIWEVKFKQGMFIAVCHDLYLAEQPLNTINLFAKKIGNIYENPELLNAETRVK